MRKITKMTMAVLLAALFMLTGCATTGIQKNAGTAFMEKSDSAYQRLGISRAAVAPWEDGMRTDGLPGSYEWWYFDSTLKDGSTLVVGFYNKDSIKPDTSIKPKITVQLDRPDGTIIKREADFGAEAFSAAKDKCDVRVGENTFRGDLHTYNIHVAIEDVKVDLKLVGTVPSWRPNTGHMAFKGKKDSYFAWLPSVPQGDVTGTITVAGKSETVSGVGYHDHNWGDVSMLELIHDWYWGRAQIGPYSVIASLVTANEKYGLAPMPIFMLAKDGKIIADDSDCVKISTADVYTDDKTGKPVANKLIYEYNDGKQHYRLTFHRQSDLFRIQFVELLKGFKYLVAKLLNVDGAYLRFTGTVTVEKLVGTDVVETFNEKAAVWELMYFAHAPAK